MKWIKFSGIAAIAILMASCTSTYITSSWKAPKGYNAVKEDKILVLGMLPDKDRSMREAVETEMTEALKQQGYQAISAYQEFGPKSFNGLNEQQVMSELKDKNIQVVMTVALLDKQKEQQYTPERVDYRPMLGYNPFWRRYVYYYDRVYTPGYYTNSTNYFAEGNLYDVGSNRLIYSVQSKTFDPSSMATFARDYSKTVVKDMIHQQIIQNKKA
ncbi:MAG: hypothetical protein ACOYVG_13060 [Bacteroidota bacterium]